VRAVSGNPFLDPARQGELYGSSARLTGRSSALLRAKVVGRPVPETIAALAATHLVGDLRLVLDIGCGRGTSSRVLAERLHPQRLVGLDASPALLAEARRRTTQVHFVRGDFHYLPLPDVSCALAVAAFCLYHSPHPQHVVAEIARVLAPDGLTILVTKSLDSYRELDTLVAAAGLDPYAARRESLYTAAHSGNLATLARTALDVIAVEHEAHRFTFTGLDHAAEYLATNPKYRLAPGLYGNPGALAAALREGHPGPDGPVTTNSVITYVVARPSRGHRP
jgi:ubiquinone/menaquinone biosynthesis C-methylase UbiE